MAPARAPGPRDEDATAHAGGSFFGRRKGHKLRIHQADLIDNLLPHLALDIGSPAPASLTELFEAAVGDVKTRNRIWRRRTSDRRSAGVSRDRIHRLRALCQRHGKNPDADRDPQYRQHPPLCRRRRGIAGLGAIAIDRPPRSDPSRPLAEATTLEAPLRAGRDHRRDGARYKIRRRISFRQRHRRLLRLDAGASDAQPRFCLDRRARLRLARAVERLHHDAIWTEGGARGACGRVFEV